MYEFELKFEDLATEFYFQVLYIPTKVRKWLYITDARYEWRTEFRLPVDIKASPGLL